MMLGPLLAIYYICVSFAHLLLSLLNNVIIYFDGIEVLHLFIVIPRKISIRKCIWSAGDIIFISDGLNILLVEVSTFDINIGKGINGRVRDKSIRNGGKSQL